MTTSGLGFPSEIDSGRSKRYEFARRLELMIDSTSYLVSERAKCQCIAIGRMYLSSQLQSGRRGGAAEADTLPPRAKVTEAAHIRRVAILLGR